MSCPCTFPATNANIDNMAAHNENNLFDDFSAGALAIVPALLGLLPYALVVGVVATSVGLTPFEVGAMSVILFAGASQLAALELMNNGAPIFVIVLTILFVNMRLIMYSASIAPHFAATPQRSRLLVGYLLTDQAYMFSLYGFRRRERPAARVAYYLGLSLPMWIMWQIGTLAGALLGTGLPQDWGLDFVLPLIFLALLIPSLQNRATIMAAIVGGGVAVATAGLPWNLGLIAGAFAGIGAGVLVAATGPQKTPAAP